MLNFGRPLTACLTLGLACILFAASPARAGVEQDFAPLVFHGPDGKTLPYRFFKPKDYDASKKYPLILAFHGAGERGDDNLRQVRNSIDFFSQPAVQKLSLIHILRQ